MTTQTTPCEHILIEERENEGCIKCGMFSDKSPEELAAENVRLKNLVKCLIEN